MSIPITFGEMEILEATADPTAGLTAGIGSVASWNDGGVGKVYWKHGVADAAWTLIGAGGAGATAVTAAAVLADNALVVGAGGARGVDGSGWTYTAATGDVSVGARGDKWILDDGAGHEYIRSNADGTIQFVAGSATKMILSGAADSSINPHSRRGLVLQQTKYNAAATPSPLLTLATATHGDSTPILSAETTDALFDFDRTVTFATGALAVQRAVRFTAPTYAFAAGSTITDAATVQIDAAPTAGANATITNAWALKVIGNCNLNGWTIDTATGDMSVGARGDKLDLSDGGEYIYSGGDNEIQLVSNGQIIRIFSGGLELPDNRVFAIGAGNDGQLLHSTDQTPDSFAMQTGQQSNAIVVMAHGVHGTDFAHPQQTNPTLFIQSADTTTIVDWISLAHNQTNGVIGVGTASALSIEITAVEALRVEDEATLAATETSLWLYDDDNGQMEQVTVGAADSGGANFKVLRIAN